MMYRILTAGAIAISWVLIYILDLTGKPYIFFIPLAILAIFQVSEKRSKKRV
ncbi:MAG: hypothetical protein F2555_02465 [Actinobacteria bacterium]|uniref:Unannotated protein n=1 Tax=freshwater metagenome TaxID=449393 RepID=A0A6J6E1B6_9ZZZZ|nr:hypothetical protein [Actinomycetota bacterium]